MTPATCCNMLAVCCTSLNACCTMLKGCCRMQTVCCKVLEMLYNGLIMRLFLLLTMTGVGVMLNEVETWFFVPHESLNEDSCVLVWASPLQETRPRQQFLVGRGRPTKGETWLPFDYAQGDTRWAANFRSARVSQRGLVRSCLGESLTGDSPKTTSEIEFLCC